MKSHSAEDKKQYIVGGIIMIALIAGGVFLYSHLTQVHLTLVNSTGAPIKDVQVVKQSRRFYLGDITPDQPREVAFPVRNDSGYVLTFVPKNKPRRYYKCPEYLYAGLHVRWTVMKDGTVLGETATLPGDWKGDPRVFDPAKSLKSADTEEWRKLKLAVARRRA